jgi:drug/metabolite transporter (DMT)-like permease
VSVTVVGLVLFAALLHASWNALLKSGGDRLQAIVIIQLAHLPVAIPFLPFLPIPAPESWPFLIGSALIHLVYYTLLITAYRHGDLGEVYPIARGLSPVLSTLIAAYAFGEWLNPVAVGGIVLVSIGIMTLRNSGLRAMSHKGFVAAVALGISVASYTVVDAAGGRLSGHAISYTLWLFVIDAPAVCLYYVITRGLRFQVARPDLIKSMLGSMLAMLAYSIAIWASTVAPVGAVSALRETGVVFAALLGWMFLAESLTGRRLIACMLVAAGALLVALRGSI